MSFGWLTQQVSLPLECSFELASKAAQRCGKNIKIIDYQHWHPSDLLQLAASQCFFVVPLVFLFLLMVRFSSFRSHH